jgi:hypothetical protein
MPNSRSTSRSTAKEAYVRETVDLPLSTLADDVGACAVAPLADLIGAHVFAAARILVTIRLFHFWPKARRSGAPLGRCPR